jgi:hypothetical protein
MAYTKTEWKARQGTNLNKFTKSQETAESVILTNTPDSVTEPGTPFTAENMNKIERGIEEAHEGIAAEVRDREAVDKALLKEISAELRELEAAVEAEEQAREEAVEHLRELINALSPESLENLPELLAGLENLPGRVEGLLAALDNKADKTVLQNTAAGIYTRIEKVADTVATKKRYATLVIGTALAGYTENDVDYLFTGTSKILQEAHDALPDGGGEIVILDGTCNLDGPVVISKDNVTIRGMGDSTVLNGTVRLDALIYTTGGNCKILDLKIMNDPDISVTNGIYVEGRSCTVDGCTIANSIADGSNYICYGVGLGEGADNCTIRNNTIANRADLAPKNAAAFFIDPAAQNCTLLGNDVRAVIAAKGAVWSNGAAVSGKPPAGSSITAGVFGPDDSNVCGFTLM